MLNTVEYVSGLKKCFLFIRQNMNESTSIYFFFARILMKILCLSYFYVLEIEMFKVEKLSRNPD